MHCKNFTTLAALVALLAIGSERRSPAGETATAETSGSGTSTATASSVVTVESTVNILGLPKGAVASGGTLMVCGGGALPNEVYDEFVRLAGGAKAKLILIPSAHPYDSIESLNFRFNGWLKYPVSSFAFMHASNREQSESEDFTRPLEEATGVWFSGGEQGRLADLYRGTKVESLLQRVLERGGVIGGTSAGAAIMSQTMIRQGSPREAVLDAGFNLLSCAVVDQHFTERGRHTRLLGALRQNPAKIGIGVDEQTAVIIRANHVRVMGQNRATIFVPATQRTLSLHLLDSGDEAEFCQQADEVETPLKLVPGLAKK